MVLAHDSKRSGKPRVAGGEQTPTLPPLRRLYAAVPVLMLLGLGVIGFLLGPGPLLLTLAGLFLAGAIFLLWTSLLAVSEETEPRIEDALTLIESSAEDERKQSVLRALKDLDYERAVGKLAEDDYQRLRARYRAEARALLSVSGVADTELERANRALEARLKELGQRPSAISPAQTLDNSALEAPAPAAELPAELPATADGPSAAATLPAQASTRPALELDALTCAGCQTRNDLDARFCKGCGAALDTHRSEA